jgi:MoaA/NifB/PqqE/SkfB family radical SAM enzyme
VTIPDNIRSGKIFDILKIAEKFNSTLALTIPVPAGKWSDNYKILINGEDRKVLNKLLKNHLLVTEDIHASYRKVRCPAGTESMYITCYGDIIPCSVLQISFGNIRKEKLKDVYMKMLRFQPLRESVSVCKAGEVKCFINKWLKPISKSNLFPVEVSNHPSFSEEQNEAKESSNIQNTAF